MKTRLGTYLVGLSILCSAAVYGADVTRLSLERQDGYVIAKIDVSGSLRFTHQTEVAKDGRPFRIIIDLIAASHALPAKEFTNLPKSPVTRIRSSQYATAPEKVVRVVFDMAAESVYRLEAQGSTLVMFVEDKSGAPFTKWTSGAATPATTPSVALPSANIVNEKPKVAVQPKTAAVLNKVIAQDKAESLTPSSKPSPTTGNEALAMQSGSPEVKTAPPTAAKPSQAPATDATPQSGSTTEGKTATQPAQTKPVTVGAVLTAPARVSSQTMTKNETSGTPANPVVNPTITKGDTPAMKATTPTSLTSAPETKAATTKEMASTTPPNVAGQAGPSATVSMPKQSSTDMAKSGAVDYSEKFVGPTFPSAKPGSIPVQPMAKNPDVANKPGGTDAKKATETVAGPSATKSTLPTTPPAREESSDDSDNATVASANSNKPVAADKAPGNTYPTDTATAIEVGSVDREDAQAENRTTSRFRRDPIMSKKIKGTLVAEFPQRLVIQYQAAGNRDPFETLIDNEKSTNSPVERRIPNIEGLSLVGIIETGFGDNRALLEDKNGFGYIMQTGDKVQKGYVLRVEDDKVYFQIFEYGWSRTVALHMIADNG